MLPVYCGVKHQYGYGLGSIFKTALFRAKKKKHRQEKTQTKQSFSGLRRNRSFQKKKQCWDLDLLFH